MGAEFIYQPKWYQNGFDPELDGLSKQFQVQELGK